MQNESGSDHEQGEEPPNWGGEQQQQHYSDEEGVYYNPDEKEEDYCHLDDDSLIPMIRAGEKKISELQDELHDTSPLIRRGKVQLMSLFSKKIETEQRVHMEEVNVRNMQYLENFAEEKARGELPSYLKAA